MEGVIVTKNRYIEKKNRSHITLSDKYGNQHIILRIKGNFKAEKMRYKSRKHGIIGQFTIKEVKS